MVAGDGYGGGYVPYPVGWAGFPPTRSSAPGPAANWLEPGRGVNAWADEPPTLPETVGKAPVACSRSARPLQQSHHAIKIGWFWESDVTKPGFFAMFQVRIGFGAVHKIGENEGFVKNLSV
jgi:hypothetical protein